MTDPETPLSTAAPGPHPAVETAFLAQESVLYDERTGMAYRLNPSASAVWMLIDGQTTVDRLVTEISEIVGAPVDNLRPDVDAVLDQFGAQGLLSDGLPWKGVSAAATPPLPSHAKPRLAHPPASAEIAVALPVFTAGGRAVLVDARPPIQVDRGLLGTAGVVGTSDAWAFVSADGASVTVGQMRWPLAGVVVAADPTPTLDQARGLLWSQARGDRAAWVRLLDTAASWVHPAGTDVVSTVEALLLQRTV
jgi:hypothetical protein